MSKTTNNMGNWS